MRAIPMRLTFSSILVTAIFTGISCKTRDDSGMASREDGKSALLVFDAAYQNRLLAEPDGGQTFEGVQEMTALHALPTDDSSAMALANAPVDANDPASMKRKYQLAAIHDILQLNEAGFVALSDNPVFLRHLAHPTRDDHLPVGLVSERLAMMHRIAAAYGRMYLAHRDTFLWMGFAAIAVNDGVLPGALQALQSAGDLQPVTVPTYDSMIKFVKIPYEAARDQVRGLARDGVRAAFLANVGIFADLYWVHQVYADLGMDMIHRMYDAKLISINHWEGMHLIDEGLREGGPSGAEKIVAGNVRLFQQEQLEVVTPFFNYYAAAMRIATDLGLIVIPNQRIRAAAMEEGKQPVWMKAADLRFHSYGPAHPRWDWLQDAAWVGFHLIHSRGLAVSEVQRAIDGTAEKQP